MTTTEDTTTSTVSDDQREAFTWMTTLVDTLTSTVPDDQREALIYDALAVAEVLHPVVSAEELKRGTAEDETRNRVRFLTWGVRLSRRLGIPVPKSTCEAGGEAVLAYLVLNLDPVLHERTFQLAEVGGRSDSTLLPSHRVNTLSVKRKKVTVEFGYKYIAR